MDQSRSFPERHNRICLSDLHIQDLHKNRCCNPDLNIRRRSNRLESVLLVEPDPHLCNNNLDFDRLFV